MLNDLKEKVAVVLLDFTGSDKLFTAYDVTQRLREENPNTQIFHNDVNELVLNQFHAHVQFHPSGFDRAYEREVEILTNGATAFVYHPSNISSSKYYLSNKYKKDLVKDSETDLTLEKRLNVPKKLLEEVGMIPGKMIAVKAVKDAIRLEMAQDSSQANIFVNDDGRVRLGQTVLKKAFETIPSRFKIEALGEDSILIHKN